MTIAGLGIGTQVHAQHNLTVTIKNVKNKAGTMFIGIFNKKENFPKDGKQMKMQKVKVTGDVVQYTFANLPKGDYALAVYQDENSDNKCNTNFIGYPTEGFGFSNNFKPKMTAPTFDQTKVIMDKNKSIVINLIR